jgi:hypothetical protein
MPRMQIVEAPTTLRAVRGVTFKTAVAHNQSCSRARGERAVSFAEFVNTHRRQLTPEQKNVGNLENGTR